MRRPSRSTLGTSAGGAQISNDLESSLPINVAKVPDLAEQTGHMLLGPAN
jgi:hypothetical protein